MAIKMLLELSLNIMNSDCSDMTYIMIVFSPKELDIETFALISFTRYIHFIPWR